MKRAPSRFNQAYREVFDIRIIWSKKHIIISKSYWRFIRRYHKHLKIKTVLLYDMRNEIVHVNSKWKKAVFNTENNTIDSIVFAKVSPQNRFFVYWNKDKSKFGLTIENNIGTWIIRMPEKRYDLKNTYINKHCFYFCRAFNELLTS